MSKNTKKSLMFAAAAVATFGALYCVSRDPMETEHWVGTGLCLAVFAWFGWHVSNDK